MFSLTGRRIGQIGRFLKRGGNTRAVKTGFIIRFYNKFQSIFGCPFLASSFCPGPLLGQAERLDLPDGFLPLPSSRGDGQPVRLSDCQTVRLVYCRLSDCYSVRLSNCCSVRLSNCQTVQKSDYQTARLSYCQTVIMSHCQTV